VNLVDH
jgi:hypothetical protein